MTPSTWLGVSLLAVLASCTSAPSRDSESPTSEAASTTQHDVTEPSAGSSLPSNAGSETPSTSSDVRVVTVASCAFEYDPSALAERSWAFDGTLVSLGTLVDSQLGTVPAATFTVNHWYRGGSGSKATVQFEMGPISEHVLDTEIGARLLVTGEPRWGGQPLEDPVAWGCGFTQPWTAEAADSWANALGT
jgi:hypothetical protein